MTLFVNVISFVGTLLVLVMAGIGAVVLNGMLCRGDRERRGRARAREAQQRIQDIGHHAQLRIMQEALRQATRRRGPDDGPPTAGVWARRS